MHAVNITIERQHPFKKKPAGKKTCLCGENKLHPHHGPFSFREFGSGSNHWLYQKTKAAWQEVITYELHKAEMPKCERVFVEGLMTFPDRHARDQGNFRFAIEKFLGDALQAGGWIENDKWDCYEFGNLAYRYDKGTSKVELMLMPG